MYGLMHLLAIFQLPKNGLQKKAKIGKIIGKKMIPKLVHFIGKDNIVFHCIIFPSMLKAHGDYILPDNVPANEFFKFRRQ